MSRHEAPPAPRPAPDVADALARLALDTAQKDAAASEVRHGPGDAAAAGASRPPRAARPPRPPRPPTTPRRRRPAPTAADLAAHPLVATQFTRALEGPLAAVLAGHPAAQEAAERMVARAWMLVADLGSGPDFATQMFAAIDRHGAPRHRQTGDVAEHQLPAMIAEGNLRERMNALGNAQQRLSRTLTRLARRARVDAGVAQMLAVDYGVDVDRLLRHLDDADREGLTTLFSAPAGTDSGEQNSMRTKRGSRRAAKSDDAANGETRAHRPLHGRMTPPLSAREREHAREGHLAERGRDPFWRPPFQDTQGAETFLMPHQDGATLMRAKAHHLWHRESRQAGMATRVSISGSTYRLRALQRIIDPGPSHDAAFLMALIGHLVPHHHAYHEVMAAAAELGAPYDPTPEGMLAHARSVLAAFPRPAAPADEENLEALARVVDEVARAMADP